MVKIMKTTSRKRGYHTVVRMVLKQQGWLRLSIYSLGIVVIGVIGVRLLVYSHAATPDVSLEPENSTSTTAPITKIVDSTASGKQAIKFGNGSMPPVSFSALLHKSGAYALTSSADVPLAHSAGLQLTIAPYKGATDAFTTALAANNMYYVDSYPKTQLYKYACPNGQPQAPNYTPCSPSSSYTQQDLLNDVKAHVQQTKNDPQVAAYYLVDDYWGNFSADLKEVYNAILSVDPKTPTMCAFAYNLVYTKGGISTDNEAQFTKALQNFSPEWCNAVAIYSYTGTANAPQDGTVEWNMHTLLPKAIADLVVKGWDSTKQPLIGMPQSFGYNPRTKNGGGKSFNPPQYRVTPTQAQLATQVSAFCNYGAQSIIGYVWNDGSTGPSPDSVQELYNSADLRQGMQDGIATCRANNWH